VSAEVRLEALAPHHASVVFADLQDRALYAYIPDQQPMSIDELRTRYERYVTAAPPDQRWLNWIAFAGDDPVGHVQATAYADRCDVAWLIFPRYWRRGYGTAAVRAMLPLLDRPIHASIDPRNAASIALARRVGLELAGAKPDGDLLFIAR
jgi:[ribosomal protein S5]-alanine N-acetyltransferase